MPPSIAPTAAAATKAVDAAQRRLPVVLVVYERPFRGDVDDRDRAAREVREVEHDVLHAAGAEAAG